MTMRNFRLTLHDDYETLENLDTGEEISSQYLTLSAISSYLGQEAHIEIVQDYQEPLFDEFSD